MVIYAWLTLTLDFIGTYLLLNIVVGKSLWTFAVSNCCENVKQCQMFPAKFGKSCTSSWRNFCPFSLQNRFKSLDFFDCLHFGKAESVNQRLVCLSFSSWTERLLSCRICFKIHVFVLFPSDNKPSRSRGSKAAPKLWCCHQVLCLKFKFFCWNALWFSNTPPLI